MVFGAPAVLNDLSIKMSPVRLWRLTKMEVPRLVVKAESTSHELTESQNLANMLVIVVYE